MIFLELLCNFQKRKNLPWKFILIRLKLYHHYAHISLSIMFYFL